jgi:hypothetical protein
MADDRTIATCDIKYEANGPRGPGFYYTIIDGEEESDLIGPFLDHFEAEKSFTAAMQTAAEEMIKQHLGLED